MNWLVWLVFFAGAALMLAHTLTQAKKPLVLARLSRGGPGAYASPDGRVFQLRSGWERVFAAWMDARRLSWRYEPMTFTLSDGKRFTPDFLVSSPLGECFVELHRMDRPPPTDGDRARIILRAQTEIQRLPGGRPLVVLGERELSRIAREVRRAAHSGASYAG